MKKAVLFLVVAGVLGGGCSARLSALWAYKRHPSLAQWEGRLEVSGLRGEVEIYRDEHGVPHIFTENEHDLFFAAGWVHAQDRLWEMVLLRAVAEGRMCELFGRIGVPGMEAMGFKLSTWEIDRRQRITGNWFMGKLAAALLQESAPEVYAQIQAYCQGVNAFIRSHRRWEELPLEFQVLRVRPEEWTPADVAAFGRFIGSMLCSNLEVELTRQAALQRFGEKRGWELVPLYYNLGPTIVPAALLGNRLSAPRALPEGGRPSAAELGFSQALSAEDALSLLSAFRHLPRLLNADAFGSNNWVVSGALTESGYPLLANDPHLNHLEPSLFYLMHLKGAGFDCYGVTFPGTPYIVLGHNPQLAWAATTSRADVQDLFIEKTEPSRPNQYFYRGEWRDFTVREEVIRIHVGGGRMAEKKIAVRQSLHGPVINEISSRLSAQAPPLAYRWTGWDLARDVRAFELAVTSRTVEEFMERWRALPDRFEPLSICLTLNRFMRGKSIEDFIAGLELLDVPNQNWIAADRAGHIIYLPGGLVPIRKKGIGVLPVPGEAGEFDWTGFIPLWELPHLIDPPGGYIATANNEVVDAEWYQYIFSTHYGEPWRALRVVELIEELKPLSVEDMKRIQNDVYVNQAEWEIPLIRQAVERKGLSDPLAERALAELLAWDFEASVDSAAPVIFYEFNRLLFQNLLADEAGKDYSLFKLEGYPYMVVNQWLAQGGSSFVDDVRTPEVEDLDDMIVKSLHDAMAQVVKKYGPEPEDYRWGRVHWIKFYHPLALVGGYRDLSVGPFEHSGGEQTVRMAKGAGFGRFPYKTLTGPCFRHIIDLGDAGGAQVMIDGSQSGQYLSAHYSNLHEEWLAGRYIQAEKEEGRIRRVAPFRLLLVPGAE